MTIRNFLSNCLTLGNEFVQICVIDSVSADCIYLFDNHSCYVGNYPDEILDLKVDTWSVSPLANSVQLRIYVDMEVAKDAG